MGKLIIIFVFLLQGCATAVVTVLGLDTAVVGGATVTTTAATTAEAIDTAKTIGDGVSYLDSGKTLTDHFTSYVSGKDCNTWRKFREDTDYCLEIESPDEADLTHSVAELELNQPVVITIPKLNTRNEIRVFQIIEGIRPVNGLMGPKTTKAYKQYQQGKTWPWAEWNRMPKTEIEVKQFQKENGIQQVGNIGPITIKALIKCFAEKDVYEIFTGEKVKRITGNTCGKTPYSDWPCMEADGCIVVD